MSRNLIKEQFEEGVNLVEKFLSDSENIDNIDKASKLLISCIKKGNKIITCGNGGSMCDAVHFAEELTGKYREDRKPLPAIAISDSAHISCVSNDYGYNTIFSRFVEALGNKNDVLFVITTSGKSENILKAVEKAKMKDLKIICLTGNTGVPGEIKDYIDVEIKVPHEGFSDRIQEVHIKIIHTLIFLIEKSLED